MADSRTYPSPSAFRRALTDRLKTLAATSRWSLPQLQRQIAYDRLLERLYLTDDRWIVKGAASLLAATSGSEAHAMSMSIARLAAKSQKGTSGIRLAGTSGTGSGSNSRPASQQATMPVASAFPSLPTLARPRGRSSMSISSAPTSA